MDAHLPRDAIVSVVKGLPVEVGTPVTHACFTGAVYRVLPIDYDRRAIGRVVLGIAGDEGRHVGNGRVVAEYPGNGVDER